VERHPDTWPVPARRAFNWATGSIRDEMVLLSHSLLRQVVDVLDVAGKLFMEGAPDLMAVNKLR
jgi:hypothetical protein